MATYNGHNEDSSGNILLSIGNGMAATVETGSTASQPYTKGALLFFNNRLCKATKAISSGATLAVGTNLSQTSLGAELTSHLRSSDGKEFYFDVKDGTYGYYPSASKVSSEFVPFGGTLSELFPITIKAYSNSASSGSNGIATAPIFLKGINTINIKMTGSTGSRSTCRYYGLDSDYAHGTAFPSTDFNIDVSSIDGLYFEIYNAYTTGEHTATVTISVVN